VKKKKNNRGSEMKKNKIKEKKWDKKNKNKTEEVS
jgi:hypothetical protein